MPVREWGLEPVRDRAMGDRATCDWRTVRERCGWYRARHRCRRLRCIRAGRGAGLGRGFGRGARAKSRSLAALGIREKQPASEGGRYRTPGALAAIALAGLKTAATTAKAGPSLLSG